MMHNAAPQINQTVSDALVEFKDIGLTMGGTGSPVNILREINLQIKSGETVAIIGPSGAGKTSLLMLLGGLEQASHGTITIAGQNITSLNEDALARFRRQNIGIVYQAFHLIPSMTALENVALPLDLLGDPNATTRAEELLQKVGLAARLTHYPSQLSGGEQQRVAVARALVSRPRLLLADEPTGNLDAANGEQVIKLLFELTADFGSSLVLVTHDAALAARCQRQIRIRDGRVVA